jgi:hypothetical protein
MVGCVLIVVVLAILDEGVENKLRGRLPRCFEQPAGRAHARYNQQLLGGQRQPGAKQGECGPWSGGPRSRDRFPVPIIKQQRVGNSGARILTHNLAAICGDEETRCGEVRGGWEEGEGSPVPPPPLSPFPIHLVPPLPLRPLLRPVDEELYSCKPMPICESARERGCGCVDQ